MILKRHIILSAFVLTLLMLITLVFSGQVVFAQEQPPPDETDQPLQIPETPIPDAQVPDLLHETFQPSQHSEEDSQRLIPFEFVNRNLLKRNAKWTEYSNYLFDSKTFIGWTIQQDGPYQGGRFTIENGAICSDPKFPGLIRTTGQFSDFSLEFEMCTEGPADVFLLLRTSPSPKNLTTSCHTIVLASTQEGHGRAVCSILGHRTMIYSSRTDEYKEDQDGLRWKKFFVFANRTNLSVTHGMNTNEVYIDEGVRRGYIGFLITKGKARFRNITWGVSNTSSLYEAMDGDLLWRKTEATPGALTARTTYQDLQIAGGPGVVETSELYDNFVIYAEFKTQNADSKAGLFFRCIPQVPGSGYECVFYNNSFSSKRKLFDGYFTGSLFNLQRARNVGAADDDWNSLTISAVDNHFQIWVNEIQTVDWTDRRPVSDPKNPDPRKGLRLSPGSVQLQGNDAGTNILFRALAIGPVSKRWVSPGDENY